MAIGTSSHLPRVAYQGHFSMMCFLVTGNGIRFNIISFHHIGIAVTTHAFPVKICSPLGFASFIVREVGYFMKTVAVDAGRRIHFSIENGPVMSESNVFLPAMASRTLFDYCCLDILIRLFDGMNVTMTVLTLEILLEIMNIMTEF
jgi:hypothetical protein